MALLGAVAAVAFVLAGDGGDDGAPRQPEPSPRGRPQGGGSPRADTRPATERRVPASERDRPVPILMYHVIGDPPQDAGFPGLYVSPADFAGQMRWLRRSGYTGVTLQQAHDFWTRGVPMPRRPVVVSFDDGYRGVWARALPVLRGLGWPGVLNFELKLLNEPEQGGLTRAHVRDLVAAGWEVNSHTISHADLTTLSPDRLRDELVRSRAMIRRLFDQPANFLCYPAGRYNPAVIAAVRRAGYLGATTTNFGNAGRDQLFALNRVRIERSDGVSGFQRKLGALRDAGVAPAPESFGGVSQGAG